ncbi:hypothetical protein DFQ27_004513 [Actinomortierella ambigua]|uniref:Uncharacterized protein n=1 Tax=Actinomortierella ambigua TaxID=1343610 RepID=A0A9P6Q1P9_9FUNG|nr:hypothetical protein DFQ27_004513 [Actinomortierella ambigua]
MSSLMLPPSDHGVSDMTIPEEEEEEEEDEAARQDDLSSYGEHSSRADEEDERTSEHHHHPHDNTTSRQNSTSAATVAKRAIDGSENVHHRSSSKIKRGAHKIKKWLTTSKSRSQDMDRLSATAMQVTPPPLKARNKSISSSSYSTASSSSSYSSSPLLAAGDEKVHPFQRLRRRPSSQRDHDTATPPPLELNMPSKDQRRGRKAHAVIRPEMTTELSAAHANVPFPVMLPTEPRLRHTRSASLQTRNAATLYKGNNGGMSRRHSSQTLRSPSTTLPSHPSSRRSLDQTSEEQLWRSLQRIAHFNQRFRQMLPGPDKPCPPIRARSSSLPRSFSPALTPLDHLPPALTCQGEEEGGVPEAVDENVALLDEHRGRYFPKARSPLGHGATINPTTMTADTEAAAATHVDTAAAAATAAAVQFEQEYLQHLEAQVEQAQAEQEMKQKRQSVWVDYVDLELPESLPPSRSVVAAKPIPMMMTSRAVLARPRSATPPSSPPPTPTMTTTTGWRGPMYWNAEAATSLQSIPSMPSSSPANSPRNSVVSFFDEEGEDDECGFSVAELGTTLADELEVYQNNHYHHHNDEDDGEEDDDDDDDDDESEGMDSSEEYDEEDEEEAMGSAFQPYPSFMTKWDMEIASECKMPADDWIHPHAEDRMHDDHDHHHHDDHHEEEGDSRPPPSHAQHPAHIRNHTNQSYLSLSSSTRRSSTVAESMMSASDTMSMSGGTARLTGFIQYKTMMPNPSNVAIGKRFFWAVEAPTLLKPDIANASTTNTDTSTNTSTDA